MVPRSVAVGRGWGHGCTIEAGQDGHRGDAAAGITGAPGDKEPVRDGDGGADPFPGEHPGDREGGAA